MTEFEKRVLALLEERSDAFHTPMGLAHAMGGCDSVGGTIKALRVLKA